tara:strand:- start:174 stop:1316 length:1143 start_codon:yes stop_codon:yes gene_type:complete
MSYSKYNGVAAADIVKIDGAAIADISKCDGIEVPAAGATRWVIAMSAGKVAHAAASDLTSWTNYDNTSGTGTPGAFDIAAGKDASGNIIYVMSRDSTSQELQVSGTDVTSTSDWTAVDLGSGDLDQYRIIWCDDGTTSGVWLCVGRQTSDTVYRSTDGAATWSGVDISGLAGHTSGSSNGIQAMTFGNGTVMMAQTDRIYYSTDYGASWTSIAPFAGNNPPGVGRALTYTNNSFALVYGRSGVIRARSCADSDVTDWGDEVTVDDGPIRNPSGTLADKIAIASAGGRVVHVTDNDAELGFFDVDGKTLSNVTTVDPNISSGRRPEDIETDGNGTWIIACRSGDVWRSTNNAVSWTRIVTNLDGSNTNLVGVCCDALGPFN